MARLREACSILLFRGQGAEREIFLVLRNPKLRFFGGWWAFPGGVLDPRDGRAEDPEARRRCALRELFEETGVLPTSLAGLVSEVDRSALRRGLLEDGDAARDGWEALLARAPEAGGELHTLGRLTTPPFAPVLYRTDFFALEVAEGEVPEIISGELVDGCFVRPEQASRWFRSGERPVVPPALFLMELWRRCAAGQVAAGPSEIGPSASSAESTRGGPASMEHFARVVQARIGELEAGELHEVRFSPGVFTVPLATATLPPATTTNCHLVGEQQIYIVDPAPVDPREQDRLIAHLEAWQREGRKLEAVVLTHHHADHVGAAARVAQHFGLPVCAHPLTLSRLPEFEGPSRALEGGDRLPLGRSPDGRDGWELEAVFSPGHSPGHLAFVDSRYQCLIAGDLVSTLSTIIIDPEDGHLRTYLDSLRALLGRPLGACLPAHGPAHLDSHTLLRHVLKHRQDREDKLRSALNTQPQSVDELVPKVYDDVDISLHGIARSSLHSGLIKLVEDGVACQQSRGWALRRRS